MQIVLKVVVAFDDMKRSKNSGLLDMVMKKGKVREMVVEGISKIRFRIDSKN